jgi:ornithine decarboxylase
MDHMAGPFPLPADTDSGDYVEIGMLGAYGSAMRTAFNGFGVEGAVVVDDEPMASMYLESDPEELQLEVVDFGRTSEHFSRR